MLYNQGILENAHKSIMLTEFLNVFALIIEPRYQDELISIKQVKHLINYYNILKINLKLKLKLKENDQKKKYQKKIKFTKLNMFNKLNMFLIK